VANIVFQGASALTLDVKGRIAMPARHREVLAAIGVSELTITKHPEGSLMIFPRPAWESFRDKVAALPMSASGWKRFFLGNATDVELDGTGRVLVAPELRQAVSLNKDVVLLGMGAHIEVWDAVVLAARENEAIAGGMPEALSGLSI
jgi:MraZ protein